MKTIKLLAISIVTTGCMLSCQKEEVNNEVNQVENNPTKEQILKLTNMGVNTENVSIKKITKLDGTSADYFVNGTDIEIPVKGFFDLEDLKSLSDGRKQYSSRSIVTGSNRTINVLGYTGRDRNGISRTGQQALERAVSTYNRLNTSLRMNLTFGTNYQSADLVVYVEGSLGSGGQAGFPQRGRPYKWARIGGRVERQGVAYTTHVITHEMGHCIGLRHTDWFRRACDGSNEGQGPMGSVHIPGTPTGIDRASVMISCPTTGRENGSLSRGDVTALQHLY